ncbi:hypothetical protein PHYBLDRAFT_175448 [Phycomyces blakesleeanus NRRL 1555(-)]|uniref:Uncharacterized protein n=1 Tax=Phycomyces blakesleeanus (strain ATCC 8743b / DSM 1359 / FGSC 10004 / NBRC 33097 / NRRL 1555) TaxID=763407 RepID=A0A162ZE16_PHYB8|nr:hypothetical protein PHYBLDRAFT_175448 [Phycomyces blakesleeanus NRRL 1555(-)]OAD66151.1 hypothetical protein PHYBLDRAFT_175448 [Phycomyces blakesleeanus NRRL 1555(-)]|eukprot:XP_018284191.1 hypothetical protein PHYBLDRAFT_175448 [Phycomyces blakesleeanus NRRL 1555(-)]
MILTCGKAVNDTPFADSIKIQLIYLRPGLMYMRLHFNCCLVALMYMVQDHWQWLSFERLPIMEGKESYRQDVLIVQIHTNRLVIDVSYYVSTVWSREPHRGRAKWDIFSKSRINLGAKGNDLCHFGNIHAKVLLVKFTVGYHRGQHLLHQRKLILLTLFQVCKYMETIPTIRLGVKHQQNGNLVDLSRQSKVMHIFVLVF